MEISEEDMTILLDMMTTEPDFVDEYLGENNPNFSVSQCSKVLKVCPNTVLYRIKVGGLKAERDSDGHWQVRAKDLQEHIKNGGVSKGFQSSERKEKGATLMQLKTGSYKYDRSSSQNVLDFLHRWEKSNTVGFSTKTLTDDFNKACATRTTEGQMSGILATLTKKKILVRKGRGIYCLADGFKPNNHAVAAPEQIEEFAIPVAQIERPEPVVKNSRWEEMKQEERHLVDKFLAKYSNPTEDFVFQIEDVASEYPHTDRKKLGKAVQNMCYNKQLEKGKRLGEYVKKATQRPIFAETKIETKAESRVQPVSNIGKNLEDVLKLNISDELKAKIIKEMMS